MYSRNSTSDISRCLSTRSTEFRALCREYHWVWTILNWAKRMWKFSSDIHISRWRNWYRHWSWNLYNRRDRWSQSAINDIDHSQWSIICWSIYSRWSTRIGSKGKSWPNQRPIRWIGFRTIHCNIYRPLWINWNSPSSWTSLICYFSSWWRWFIYIPSIWYDKHVAIVATNKFRIIDMRTIHLQHWRTLGSRSDLRYIGWPNHHCENWW